MERIKCYCCGTASASAYLGLYGKGSSTRSWICRDCGRAMANALQRSPHMVTVTGKPTLRWSTIARAEQLAQAGAGWTADHVMRKALDLLEAKTS